jgi:peroxiredoxin 2/4
MFSLINRTAPDFTTSAVNAQGEIETLNFHKAIEGKYAVLVFYPLDFTFVCPTELIQLNNMVAKLKAQNVEIFTVSIDSQYVHQAWRNTPRDQGGIGPVEYTMLADASHSICRTYGVEHPEAHVAFRATFIIDDEKKVWSQMVNDLPLGRNFDEITRLIDAIQFHKTHGEVCPANWQKGKPGMVATEEGVKAYLGENCSETEA